MTLHMLHYWRQMSQQQQRAGTLTERQFAWYTTGRTHLQHRCSSGLNSLEMNALATASSLGMSVESASRPSSCARGFIFSGSKNHSLSGHKLTIAESTPVLFSPKRASSSPMQLSSISKRMRLCMTDSFPTHTVVTTLTSGI